MIRNEEVLSAFKKWDRDTMGIYSDVEMDLANKADEAGESKTSLILFRAGMCSGRRGDQERILDVAREALEDIAEGKRPSSAIARAALDKMHKLVQ